MIKYLSCFITVMLFGASFVSATEYVQGEKTLDFVETAFTETLFYQYFNGIINGFGVKSLTKNGQICTENFYALMDQRYEFD